jgi:hypothetical protein
MTDVAFSVPQVYDKASVFLLAVADDERRVDILPVTAVEFEKADLLGKPLKPSLAMGSLIP